MKAILKKFVDILLLLLLLMLHVQKCTYKVIGIFKATKKISI